MYVSNEIKNKIKNCEEQLPSFNGWKKTHFKPSLISSLTSKLQFDLIELGAKCCP